MADYTLQELLASAEEQIVGARAEAERQLRLWGEAEAKGLEDFFLEEGRLTVINQADVTARVRERVPAIKAEVGRIAGEARAAVQAWAVGLSVADLGRRDQLVEGLEAAIAPSRGAFGALFIGLGYRAGSNAWDTEWKFYYPKTGTHRSAKVPMGFSSELDEAQKVLGGLEARAKELRRQIQQRDASDLWGD